MFLKLFLLILFFNSLFSSDLEKILESEHANFELSGFDIMEDGKLGKSISRFQDIKKIDYDLPYKLRFEDFSPLDYLIVIKTEKDAKSAHKFIKDNQIQDVAFAYQFSIYEEEKIRIVYGYYKDIKHAKEDLNKIKKTIKTENFKPYIMKVALSQLEYYKFKVNHR